LQVQEDLANQVGLVLLGVAVRVQGDEASWTAWAVLVRPSPFKATSKSA
jgi:hypothetical protein